MNIIKALLVALLLSLLWTQTCKAWTVEEQDEYFARHRREARTEMLNKIGFVSLVIALPIAGWFITRRLKSRAANNASALNVKLNKPIAWAIVAVLVLGTGIYALHLAGTKTDSSDGPRPSVSFDPDPSGTWTEGDKGSVYNRLVISSSGGFAFQTVDFTGDVKGGYRGRWNMQGNSIHFEWGGLADGGSCSGKKTGPNSLVFGSSTFTR